MDSQTLMLFGGIGAILVLASLIGLILKLRTRGTPNAVIDNLNARINAWWVMVVVIGIAFWLGTGAVILLFYAVSFYALREFLTLTPTRRSDYPALVAAFYVALPLQYMLIYSDWFGLFSIFIPVYVFPPTNPSTVLEGDSLGAILCLPNSLPHTYCSTSDSCTTITR
jgi:phosphatidate cytidylyltransferase